MKKTPSSFPKETLMLAKKHLATDPYCSNQQLASNCNISVSYLYKIFKTYEKQTPNEYRQKILCDKATELLTNTDLSIEEISRILNFSSSNYLRKVYKEHTGMSPREFRKLYSL